MFELLSSHDDVGSVAAYTLIVNWYAVGRLFTEGLPAFLAWWMPLNLAVAVVAAVSDSWMTYCQACALRVKKPRARVKPVQSTNWPLKSWLILTLVALPMFLMAVISVTTDEWRRHRRAIKRHGHRNTINFNELDH